ncbi:hypothetical protein FGG08_001238 [Glutinoglossum americanum]|uniref:Major facilitator superfamily (MFS) profile domain-containing protein n=1 Tax=Glutinoglossum americanum TaxID=1670608 RepID=A0A9P8L5G6_9PEZI|nr:hypothetical protein FGG08_001238 [Glutinoglossum americanum]
MNDNGNPSASDESQRELHSIYSHPGGQSVCSGQHNEMQEGTLKKPAPTESLPSKGDVDTEMDKKSRASGDSQESRDIEKGPTVERSRTPSTVQDPNIVTWSGPDDPENPKNWSNKKKWGITLVVSAFTLISPVSSTMVAPALNAIAKEFHITNTIESQLTLSIFVLAYAVGPLAMGPLSEVYGRVPVLQLSNLFYFVFNTACGASQSKGQMIAFRFLSGIGGSAPMALGGGVLSDCWRAEERGKSMSIYSLAPLLGPAIGPIAGGFITMKTTWRWVFYATSIACALVQGIGMLYLRETYPPKILLRKAQQLRKETGKMDFRTEYEQPDKTLIKILRASLIRPFKLLGTQPIIQALAVYMAYLYGLIYLVLSTFPTLWEGTYGESVGVGGLNYLSLGVGLFFGAQICAPLQDRVYRYLKKTRSPSGSGSPEFRVPLMIPGSVMVPIGLFWYGWSAHAKLHWIMPNIGAVIFTCGSIVCFQCIQTYLVDSYTRYAASAIGAATVLRSLAGFAFPLFAPRMYEALGYGWGNSLLGFAAVLLGWPAPILLWKYGAKLRAKSPFAAGG